MGGGVPSAALARRVGRENGGSSGGGDADGDRSDAPVRRWVRIWSITDVWVMTATRRIVTWHTSHRTAS